MKYFKLAICVALSFFSFMVSAQNAPDYSVPVPGRWSAEKINRWYKELPWLVGCNYYPATAINQIDMWQASTWDPETIDKELGWAESIGMNTLRVFLHDVVWADDEKGLYKRMDQFLDICQKHGIRPWFVFFDDCHFPNPKLGKQPLPVSGYHNSGWVNCPAREVGERYAVGKETRKEAKQLKGYVQKTMSRFAKDKRVLMWELYNEPGRGSGLDGDMGSEKVDSNIGDRSNRLVYDSWVWAREINPSQPVTSTTSGALGTGNIKINRANSDIFSIHSYYSNVESVRKLIKNYQSDGRPVVMTEWLARSRGNTVEKCLPLFKEMGVGAVNWGFVSGKSGTIWPWSSRKTKDGKKLSVNKLREEGHVVRPGESFPEPEVWFHDLFRMDGTPFDQKEIEIFRKLTGKHLVGPK
ncbi:hypothetical protein FUAX_39080 (plasmid) [Fulvitalea axinellae]|uniref:Glycoside hydrolase family 5 domain-containing protein n=1 Tax=Fulvitalea axinellae TaxID=1182444 RepID=A0AAU9CQM4_9BACT|nr:hypothetical protein FUAX_39080 [Fulvitalea axinellae]